MEMPPLGTASCDTSVYFSYLSPANFVTDMAITF